MQKSKKFIIEDKQGNNMYPATFADVVYTEDGGNIAEKLKSHTHTKSQITDFAHTHTKSEISDFPTSLPANGGNADTVGGKRAEYFAPKDNPSFTGRTTVEKELIVNDTFFKQINHANFCVNSTFKYGTLGWGNKQGSATWDSVYYKLVGHALTVSPGSQDTSWIDNIGDPLYSTVGEELYFSALVHTHDLKNGSAKIELVLQETGDPVESIVVQPNNWWVHVKKKYTVQKEGSYFLRIVVNHIDAPVHISKIKLEHLCHTQWCECDKDAMLIKNQIQQGVIKSIQRGVFTSQNAGSVYEVEIPISTINPSKSSVSIQGGMGGDRFRSYFIKSVSNNNFVIGSSNDMNVSGISISWEVVEYV